jgi:glutamine---fructose-6-phosphate transaminase (isomerizing)
MQGQVAFSADREAANRRVAESEESMSRLPMLENIFGQPESHRTLLEFHRSSGRSSLQACGRRIRNAEGRVIFTGMGASLFAAIPAGTRLMEKGFPAQVVESAELLHYGSSGLRPGDLGILISRSGASVEVLRLAEKMKAIGMTLIGVTNVPGSELECLADMTLSIGAQADQLVAVQTYTGTVLALLLLAEEAIGGDIAAFADASANAMPTLSALIEDCFGRSESWQEWLTGPGPLYLLGRGPALASAYEGALLLHETTKASAVSMSSGQFRHGPVEAVSADFRAVVFGSPEPTRALDRSLAGDLLHMGANVRWIGPAGEKDGGHATSLVSWPEVPPALSAIFEIVPLQFAAYRLALWRGIVPGDFRYASEITAAESGFPLFQSRLATV